MARSNSFLGCFLIKDFRYVAYIPFYNSFCTKSFYRSFVLILYLKGVDVLCAREDSLMKGLRILVRTCELNPKKSTNLGVA